MLECGKIYDYKKFKISPVQLYHDVPQCGWRVFIGNEKAIYMTDTKTVDGISAKDYNLYLIEANYEDVELQERIKEKREQGKFAYEISVPYRHLSKAQADEFILKNMGEDSEYVYLHQHRSKNANRGK